MVHETIQTWLCPHVLFVIANGILGALAVIVTLTKQLLVDICPEVFILNDFVNVGPSSSVNVGRMVATQPQVPQPDGESFSGMVDLVTGEFAISITPLSQATIGLIQESDTTSFVVDQRRHQVLFTLPIEVLACSSKVEIISLTIFVPLEYRYHHFQGLEASYPPFQWRFASCPIHLALRVDEMT